MNSKLKVVLLALVVAVTMLSQLGAAETTHAAGKYEYATIRWAGKDNTHIIRPGGQVEFVGPEIRNVPRPDRVDERSFYMNIIMNGLVKEGWEFAGMTNDEIVMKREIVR